MQFGSKLKYWIANSFRVLLLILFLGYYGSITLFTHCHIINGVTIIHSHPYRSDKGNDSSGLQHTGKELMVIRLLSQFFTTAVVISFATVILRSLLYEIPVKSTADGYADTNGNCTYSLRAPPFEIPYFGLV